MINNNLLYPKLEKICSMTLDDFKHLYPDSVVSCYANTSIDQVNKTFSSFSELNSGDTYIYIDNGASILGVCHLDYVSSLQYSYCEADLNEPTVFCPRLDDRLGVFGLLHILPELCKYNYDILLTTGEEHGISSARMFDTDKKYNWIFELDRRGTDCVTYHIDSVEWRKTLKSSGWIIGYGSFSDIAYLRNLGVCAVNFGIGYHDEHTKVCHAFMNEFSHSMKKVAYFINRYAEQEFKSDGRYYDYGNYYASYYGYGHGTHHRSYTYNKTKKKQKNKKKDVVEQIANNLMDGKCYSCGTPLISILEQRSGICDVCSEYYESIGYHIGEDGRWYYIKDIGNDISEKEMGVMYNCSQCQKIFYRRELEILFDELYCKDCMTKISEKMFGKIL